MKIYTYGVFLLLAFFWGLFLIWKMLRLTAYKEEVIFDGIFFALLGSIFFARFFYVLANFSAFGFSFLKFILVNAYPGFSLYGGVFGGLLFLLIFCLYKKINFSHLVDYLIPGIFVALGFGKLGAFFSGSEIGTRTNFFLSVKYPGYEGLRHSVGLYEALLFFIFAYFSYKILFKIRREELFQGFNLLFFLWGFSGVYFLLDVFKKQKFFLFGFNFNRWFSFLLWLTISFFILYYFREAIISFLRKVIFYGWKTFRGKIKAIKTKINFRKGKNRKGDKGA